MSASVAGTWTLHFAWNVWQDKPISPKYYSETITFNDNGTFSGKAGDGHWSVTNGAFTMNYNNPGGQPNTYTGNIIGYAMLGTMQITYSFSQSSGWWYAVKNDIPVGAPSDDVEEETQKPF